MSDITEELELLRNEVTDLHAQVEEVNEKLDRVLRMLETHGGQSIGDMVRHINSRTH